MTRSAVSERGRDNARLTILPSLFWAGLLLAGLVVLDRSLQAAGTFLVRERYTPDNMLNSLVSQQHDIVIVGGCRAAQHLDSKILAEITGQRVFNAGRVVDGVGFTDVAAHLAIPRTKRVVIVLDVNNLEETAEVTSAEIEKYRVWLSALEPDYRKSFAERYSFQLPWLNSGLLNFRGKGIELIAAAKAYRSGQAVDMKDAYDPRKVNLIPNPTLTDPIYESRYIKRTSRHDAFAVSTIEGIVQRAKAGGVEPILMLSPMHRGFSTEDVNQRGIDLVRDLASKHNVRFLNYLGNYTEFGQKDAWWTDTGHMNQVGAEVLSRLVGAELQS